MILSSSSLDIVTYLPFSYSYPFIISLLLTSELVISNNSGNVNIDHVLDSGKVGITLENSVTLKKDIEEEEF